MPAPSNQSVTRSLFPVLLLLFAGSGCSALIYEIVWYQLLQLVIGSTAVSLGVLLATFMGGLCLGSFGLPRWVSRRFHPLRVYAWIELGIGLCGVAALFGMPLIDRLYTSAVGHGFPAVLLRAFMCAICLVPPTALMGASLPAAARWIEATPEGVSRLGLLYGGNTVGAVFGCLLAGFYLLRVFDMAVATYVAVAINAVVALTSMALAGRTSYHSAPDTPPGRPGQLTTMSSPLPWPAYMAIAFSGASALGAEVVWTRVLGLLLGATVYTFSIILAVFLIGIGVGTGAGSLLSRQLAHPRLAIGYCQMLLAAAIAWTAFMLARSLPYWPVNPLLSNSPVMTFQIDLVRCLWAILPPALLWGASFPFALAAVASPEDDTGRMVGGIYAANTLGAILGALAFSLLLIPHIGTGRSERVLITLAAVGGFAVLVPAAWRSRSRPAWAALAASFLAVAWLVWTVSPIPGMLIAYGRRIMTSSGRARILYTGEGLNSSIAISQWDDGALQFHVSGKVEASTEPYDMRLQRMLGHLPALFHPQPRSVLVVGFGAGVTAGAFTLYPEIQRIVVCEMERLVPRIATIFFRGENYDVFDDPRARIIYDDARHYVLTAPEKFDIITSDPIHPWVKGSATLYSKEYFELVKRHLNPGGVVTQWVPLYESDLDTVKSEIATFFAVFPDGTIWANENGGGGYDVVMFGPAGDSTIDVDMIERRLAVNPAAARSLKDVGFESAMALLTTYAGRARDLTPWLQGAQINRDGNLRLQYLAGLALNVNGAGQIYEQLLSYRRIPEGIFSVSPGRKQALDMALAPRN
jgi:spermidine synthase